MVFSVVFPRVEPLRVPDRFDEPGSFGPLRTSSPFSRTLLVTDDLEDVPDLPRTERDEPEFFTTSLRFADDRVRSRKISTRLRPLRPDEPALAMSRVARTASLTTDSRRRRSLATVRNNFAL